MRVCVAIICISSNVMGGSEVVEIIGVLLVGVGVVRIAAHSVGDWLANVVKAFCTSSISCLFRMMVFTLIV